MALKQLLEEFDKIGFKIGEYAISGSGPLAVRNLREPRDIDIIVLPVVWDKLKLKYPVRSEWFETIQIGNVTVLGFGSHFAKPSICSVEQQIEEADIIDNHAFVRLETIRKFKEALESEKNLNDIKLIDDFINKTNIKL